MHKKVYLSTLLLLTACTTKETTSAEILSSIKKRAIATDSDIVLIYKNDIPLLEYKKPNGDEPMHIFSITKSFCSLAMGFMLEDGLILSLDTPLLDLLPKWKEVAVKNNKKAAVTLGHLLEHTSGISEEGFDPGTITKGDIVATAAHAPLQETPGTTFRYNNSATTLLPKIVELKTGKTIDKYLKEKLFTPLGITEWSWAQDESGNYLGSAGLHMEATDLLKVGQMLANGGTWHGKQILKKETIDLLTEPSKTNPIYGRLWWLLEEGGQVKGFAGHGWIGQFLIVLPESKLVGIRLKRLPKDRRNWENTFNDFYDLMLKLHRSYLKSSS